ncbi:hypothetical protein ElyMa_006530500, partial [Elysia marginata]
GTTIKMVNVLLSKSTCTKQDVAAGKTCEIPADSRPKYHCAAQLYWDTEGLQYNLIQMGTVRS